MKTEHTKKFWIGFGIGGGVSLVTLFALFLLLLGYFFFGGTHEATEDIAEYTTVMNKYTDIQSGLMTFPEEIPEHTRESRFYFSHKDTWDDPACEIFLQCAYEPEAYEAEVERLENTGKRYGSVVKKLRKEEEKYNYPAYVAIDNNCYAYEYALLTGETEITYVYLALVEHSTLHFEKKYLPKGYGESGILEIDKSPLSGYCIYQAGGEGGNPLAYEGSYDYTREENVDVEHHHYEAVGYNRFSVCTVLDEEDTERIADCSYIYYENAIASVNSLPEENSYIDLAGYPFVSLEVDKERMEAYVTYLDNGQEKVRTYKFFVKK